MTYTMTIKTETAIGTGERIYTNLEQGDVENLKEAARITAKQGDTITHKVTAEK